MQSFLPEVGRGFLVPVPWVVGSGPALSVPVGFAGGVCCRRCVAGRVAGSGARLGALALRSGRAFVVARRRSVRFVPRGSVLVRLGRRSRVAVSWAVGLGRGLGAALRGASVLLALPGPLSCPFAVAPGVVSGSAAALIPAFAGGGVRWLCPPSVVRWAGRVPPRFAAGRPLFVPFRRVGWPPFRSLLEVRCGSAARLSSCCRGVLRLPLVAALVPAPCGRCRPFCRCRRPPGRRRLCPRCGFVRPPGCRVLRLCPRFRLPRGSGPPRARCVCRPFPPARVRRCPPPLLAWLCVRRLRCGPLPRPRCSFVPLAVRVPPVRLLVVAGSGRRARPAGVRLLVRPGRAVAASPLGRVLAARLLFRSVGARLALGPASARR